MIDGGAALQIFCNILGHLRGGLGGLSLLSLAHGGLPFDLRHGRHGDRFRCGAMLRHGFRLRRSQLRRRRRHGRDRRRGRGRPVRRNGGLPGQYLIRRRHGRPAVEEPLLLGHCLHFSGLPCQRTVVHWNIDLRPAPGRGARGSGCGRLFHPAAALPGDGLRQFFLLILGPGTGPHSVHHVRRRHMEGSHHHKDGRQYENDSRARLAEHRRQGQGNDAADQAAALEGLSLRPQALDQRHAPDVFPPCQDQVQQTARQHRRQQCAPHPQAHRASPVERQDTAGDEKHGGQQPIAVANQSLDGTAEKVHEDGLNGNVPERGKNGQQQAHHGPDLPPDGFRGRRRFFPRGRTAGGSACPLPARGLLLCCGHCASVLSRIWSRKRPRHTGRRGRS